MEVRTQRIPVTKRYPLTISRGTIRGSINVLVEVVHDGIVGWGEMAPGSDAGESADDALASVEQWREALVPLAPDQFQLVEQATSSPAGVASARAALDMACHDWWGKRLSQPLWRLWGLDRRFVPVTSVTLGISPPEVVRERLPEILGRTGARALKVKLGSPSGIDADRSMFAAAREAAGAAASRLAWRVDANGGWSGADAAVMCRWLEERGVEYVEQPLPRDDDAGLVHLHRQVDVPLYVDESVRVATDVARLASHVDGVNLKLMKCGGLREALRIVHTARAHGLGVMIGCMGETSLAISAGAHLSPLVDHVDLDSHLNLVDDPFQGPSLAGGRVLPGDGPGLGVSYAPARG